MTKQERDRKVETLASEIYTRLVTGMMSRQFDAAEIAKVARTSAEAFYPDADDTPSPSVPIKKAV